MKAFPVLLFCATLVLTQVHTKPAKVHANCCLCMCGAKDETQCSAMCIHLQHSKKIVEEKEMNVCTTKCKQAHVVVLK